MDKQKLNAANCNNATLMKNWNTKIFTTTAAELQRKHTKIDMCPAAMQNACMHPQQGAEGTAVRSSTFLFKNANQATNIVLEAQSYCTCSQSTMPAQLSTLKSTC